MQWEQNPGEFLRNNLIEQAIISRSTELQSSVNNMQSAYEAMEDNHTNHTRTNERLLPYRGFEVAQQAAQKTDYLSGIVESVHSEELGREAAAEIARLQNYHSLNESAQTTEHINAVKQQAEKLQGYKPQATDAERFLFESRQKVNSAQGNETNIPTEFKVIDEQFGLWA